MGERGGGGVERVACPTSERLGKELLILFVWHMRRHTPHTDNAFARSESAVDTRSGVSSESPFAVAVVIAVVVPRCRVTFAPPSEDMDSMTTFGGEESASLLRSVRRTLTRPSTRTGSLRRYTTTRKARAPTPTATAVTRVSVEASEGGGGGGGYAKEEETVKDWAGRDSLPPTEVASREAKEEEGAFPTTAEADS